MYEPSADGYAVRERASAEAKEGGERGLSSLEKVSLPGQAEKLDPQPQVCFAFGFLKENPLWPNCPST